MKKKMLIAILLTMLLASGCAYKGYDCPQIEEYGLTDTITDNTKIIVNCAKTGLQGYEIVEVENGVDVVLHYSKKEKN